MKKELGGAISETISKVLIFVVLAIGGAVLDVQFLKADVKILSGKIETAKDRSANDRKILCKIATRLNALDGIKDLCPELIR